MSLHYHVGTLGGENVDPRGYPVCLERDTITCRNVGVGNVGTPLAGVLGTDILGLVPYPGFPASGCPVGGCLEGSCPIPDFRPAGVLSAGVSRARALSAGFRPADVLSQVSGTWMFCLGCPVDACPEMGNAEPFPFSEYRNSIIYYERTQMKCRDTPCGCPARRVSCRRVS